MKRLKLLAGVLLFGMIGNGSTRAADPECSFPDDVTYLGRALPQMTSRLSAGGPLTIVALGSSSTAGAGASKPEAAYPARLQEHLASRLRTMVRVVNRGRNGDRIGDMLSRLPADVIPLRPDLVVWQVGTNALLTDLEAKTIGTLFVRGAGEISATRAGLIVIDPQYAPKVLLHGQAEEVVRVIGALAHQTGAALFRRFELMRFWHERHLGYEQFLDPDQLHMNDWSYDCLANALATAMIRTLGAGQ